MSHAEKAWLVLQVLATQCVDLNELGLKLQLDHKSEEAQCVREAMAHVQIAVDCLSTVAKVTIPPPWRTGSPA